jgi:hypothetical protein
MSLPGMQDTVPGHAVPEQSTITDATKPPLGSGGSVGYSDLEPIVSRSLSATSSVASMDCLLAAGHGGVR